jgi:uncharacterized RDD family membrane protein YckC
MDRVSEMGMERGKTGVLFRKSDYVGVIPRVLIDIVDIAVIGIPGFGTLLVAASMYREERIMGLLLLVWVILGFLYLGPWKSTGYPTLGYWIFRVKLVNASGNKVDFWQASGRALFLLIGPANYLIDLFWLYGEIPRQALRDKFNGTYLIKKNAVIESKGKLVPKVLHVMGYRVRIEEIENNVNSNYVAE